MKDGVSLKEGFYLLSRIDGLSEEQRIDIINVIGAVAKEEFNNGFKAAKNTTYLQ